MDWKAKAGIGLAALVSGVLLALLVVGRDSAAAIDSSAGVHAIPLAPREGGTEAPSPTDVLVPRLPAIAAREPVGGLALRVVDEFGRGLSGVEAWSAADGRRRLAPEDPRTQSDSEGMLTLPRGADPDLNYSIRCPGRRLVLRSLREHADTGVPIVVASGAAAEVQCVDGLENPVSDVRVVISLSALPDGEADADMASEDSWPGDDEAVAMYLSVSGADGVARFEGLEPGRYHVSAYHESYGVAFTMNREQGLSLSAPGILRLRLAQIYGVAMLVRGDTPLGQEWSRPGTGYWPRLTAGIEARAKRVLSVRYPGALVDVVLPAVDAVKGEGAESKVQGSVRVLGRASGWTHAAVEYRPIGSVTVIEHTIAAEVGSAVGVVRITLPTGFRLRGPLLVRRTRSDPDKPSMTSSVIVGQHLELSPGEYEFLTPGRVLERGLRPRAFRVEAGSTLDLPVAVDDGLVAFRFVDSSLGSAAGLPRLNLVFRDPAGRFPGRSLYGCDPSVAVFWASVRDAETVDVSGEGIQKESIPLTSERLASLDENGVAVVAVRRSPTSR